MTLIEEQRKRLEQEKGKKIQIENTISKLTKRLKISNKELIRHEKAREIIKEAGLKTQRELQYHISDITSLALGSVFNKPYELEAEFVERRNKTECDLYFVRNENKVDPMDASGGGAVDVAAFALRIASWSMQNPKSNNTIVLDEPLKNLDATLQEKGSIMLKEVSKRLGIQFIIVTHEDILTFFADKVFPVKIKNLISKIKENE